MADLAARRILLISPAFFGYQERITCHLRSRGAEVDWIDDRASNHAAFKAVVRLNLPGASFVAQRHFAQALHILRDRQYTDVLVVNPEACRLPVVEKVRRLHPKARFSLYMWDSFENRKYLSPSSFLRLFDKASTFDDVDAKRHGMQFRPLFFSDEAPARHIEPRFAFSFIGTMHSDRYRIVSALNRQSSELGLATFVYPFLATRAIYWVYRASKPEFRGTTPGDFRYVSMPYAEALEVTGASLAAVDIEHPRQRGLTMRTFEVLAAGKKLITTNARIRDYDFYSLDRICVIDRHQPRIEKGFFEAPPAPWETRHRIRYGIRAWADDVLG
jgi:hypothetical protein